MTEHWGAISAGEWRTVPCTIGRAATQADVEAGTAVFYVQGESEAAPITLPCCAVQTLDDGTQKSVVVVQAELGPRGVILGVRPLTGGNAVCMATEVQFLPTGF
jgi:hypothetical protein